MDAMTVYLLETSDLTDEQLGRMNGALPAVRRQRAEKIARSMIRRESIAAAYLTLYGLACGQADGRLIRPDTDRLLTGIPRVKTLSETVGWPMDEKGKPFADGVDFPEGKRYVSLSHSEGLTAVAVSRREVGADVQRIPASSPAMLRRIAARFHPQEKERLDRVADDRLPREFCRLWAAKESVMKLCGKGLALPLSSFCIAETLVSELDGRRIRLRAEDLDDAVFAAAFWTSTG